MNYSSFLTVFYRTVAYCINLLTHLRKHERGSQTVIGDTQGDVNFLMTVLVTLVGFLMCYNLLLITDHVTRQQNVFTQFPMMYRGFFMGYELE